MKNDAKSLWPAEVEVENVRFSKGVNLGIDFSNKIDAWSKMEFKFRHQIKQLRQQGSMHTPKVGKEILKSLEYAMRFKID